MDITAAIALAALVVSIATFGRAWWSDSSKETARRFDGIDADMRKAREDFSSLREKVGIIESRVEVFWKGLSVDAAMILHKPSDEHRRRDELIDKYLKGGLTPEEVAEFTAMLERIKNLEEFVAGERLAAAILLRALQQKMVF